ncbi:serine-threonine kinase receptor-associated protein-like [Olea europaea var. sylvestris]|uniref:serine-threonine kinase receptor-associated protein-like n=1 Tax=Olea europaea var. sylvestris TaxID=158386 RepID=UPI000C1CDAF0|nr:serine-threonine kinase receptor-associated protein-like [Olea europaea var. sylvestris]
MDKKKVVVPLVCHGHSRPVVDLFYSPITPDGFFLVSASKGSIFQDTHLLLTGGVEKVLRIYDLNRLDAPPREVENSPGSVRTLSWLHSDQTILSTCTDIGGVRLWDVRTGKISRTLETKSSVTSAEVSQDGRYITTADGSTVKFWDANHFGLVKSYNMPCIVESASLEPKYGNKFIAGGEDMWVRVFDFHTGAEIGCNKGHHGPVHCVRFSPGGESYASGSEDGTIRIWQTGPLTHDEQDSSSNGPIQNMKDAADEVTEQIESVHIAEEKNDGNE